MDLNIDDNGRVMCFSLTGQRHLKMQVPCEDAYTIVEKDHFLFYGLADGQSGKQFCKIGGKAVLAALASYIETNGIQALRDYKYRDEIRYRLLHVIRDTIFRVSSEYKASEEEFASTVVVAAVDPQSGIYITVHLGDGGIIGLKQDDEVVFISSPENGITTCYTWLTTSPDALMHLRIGFGQVEEFKKILLFTDGASLLCYGKHIMPETKTLLMDDNEIGSLFRYLSASEPEDDASIIVF